MDAVLNRLAEGEAAWGAEEGELALGARGVDVLHRLQTAVADNQQEFTRALGKGRVRPVLEALWAPDMRDALRLSVLSEEEARELEAPSAAAGGGGGGGGGGDDDGRSSAGWTYAGGAPRARAAVDARVRAARLWRRRLWKLTIPVRIDAKLRFATAHDDVDHKGHRTLINSLNRRTPEDGLSYYQRSTLQYGRERRGSTCIAGAWEGVVLTRAETDAAAAVAAAAAEAEAEAAEAGAEAWDDEGGGGHPPYGREEAALLEDEAALMAEVSQLDAFIGARFGGAGGAGSGGF